MTDDSEQLKTLIHDTIRSGRLRHAVLSRPVRRDADLPERIDIRRVTLRRGDCFQWSGRQQNQMHHTNLSDHETAEQLVRHAGCDYRHIHLTCDHRAWTARYSRRGRCRLQPDRSFRPADSDSSQTADHNRRRAYLLPENEPVPFLIETGIMTPEGRVRKRHYRKFRQINRYVEFIADVVDRLPQDDVVRVVDFGCGKSSLTFAVHHYLTRVAGRRVDILGLDRRQDVIDSCRRISESLQLPGLHFEQGDIAGCRLEPPVHLVISLHACDTATDDALARAVQWDSDVILAVPCCQHELLASADRQSLPLLERHGILKERLCVLATDAVRAAILERAGWQTQVIEFIETEHTPRNVLIRAVRRTDEQARSLAAQAAEQQLAQFSDRLGIPPLHLERLLFSDAAAQVDRPSAVPRSGS